MNSMIPILLYHSVAARVAPQFSRWAVRPAMFAAPLAYLHDHKFTPLTVSQLVFLMTQADHHLPERPVVITFDDGLADFYTEALPRLQEYGFSATLYLTTGFVGG